jgi:hypothetical protein
MFTNIHVQRQIVADRHEQLRRQAGAGRLRRDDRWRHERPPSGRSR